MSGHIASCPPRPKTPVEKVYDWQGDQFEDKGFKCERCGNFFRSSHFLHKHLCRPKKVEGLEDSRSVEVVHCLETKSDSEIVSEVEFKPDLCSLKNAGGDFMDIGLFQSEENSVNVFCVNGNNFDESLNDIKEEVFD